MAEGVMTPDADLEDALVEQVREALAAGAPVRIVGGDSKAFVGRRVHGAPLAVAGHRGIVAYQPGELVITARAGTPLAELRSVLEEQRQMLPFEPPAFGPAATVGGMVATGISGPRRPWGGAVRDAVLGVKLINGRGEVLRLGGQVMKNVAGYDLSRLMVGAQGTLGVLLEVSIKVLPRPAMETTRVFELGEAAAASRLRVWAARQMPVSASLWGDGRLSVRLSGSVGGVEAAAWSLGGEPAGAGEWDGVWRAAREHTLPFFAGAAQPGNAPLWRLSLPAAAPPLDLPGETLVEWAGAQRWLRGDHDALKIRARAAALGGHATLFRGPDGAAFPPLPAPLMALHQRIKAAFDPRGVFNPGRLYEGL